MLPDSGVLGQQNPVWEATSSAFDVLQSSEQAHVGLESDSVVRPRGSLTDLTFNAYIAHTGFPILVKFSAAWYERSRSTTPRFEAAAKQLLHGRFASIDIDVSPEVTRANAVRSVPTLILYRNGQELARRSGAMSVHLLKHWVHASLISGAKKSTSVAC